MGIWNAAISISPAPRTDSLPLMGIWNEYGGHLLVLAVVISLPLMGIWNPQRVVAAPVLGLHSLPLMGIWNGDVRPRRDPPDRNLITPHGDLELWKQARKPLVWAGSLPLMGIWNQ